MNDPELRAVEIPRDRERRPLICSATTWKHKWCNKSVCSAITCGGSYKIVLYVSFCYSGFVLIIFCFLSWFRVYYGNSVFFFMIMCVFWSFCVSYDDFVFLMRIQCFFDVSVFLWWFCVSFDSFGNTKRCHIESCICLATSFTTSRMMSPRVLGDEKVRFRNRSITCGCLFHHKRRGDNPFSAFF